ncbi:hypothetical protein ACVWZ6_007290 [Bradyrhizobium sp. GM6.1]
MSNDIDFYLSPDQWEVLKALRYPVSNGRLSKAYLIESLVKLGPCRRLRRRAGHDAEWTQGAGTRIVSAAGSRGVTRPPARRT